MTDIALDGEAVAGAPRAALLDPLAIPGSLVVHAVVILLLASVVAIRQLPRLAPPRSIDVEIISELEYEDALRFRPTLRSRR